MMRICGAREPGEENQWLARHEGERGQRRWTPAAHLAAATVYKAFLNSEEGEFPASYSADTMWLTASMTSDKYSRNTHRMQSLTCE